MHNLHTDLEKYLQSEYIRETGPDEKEYTTFVKKLDKVMSDVRKAKQGTNTELVSMATHLEKKIQQLQNSAFEMVNLLINYLTQIIISIFVCFGLISIDYLLLY